MIKKVFKEDIEIAERRPLKSHSKDYYELSDFMEETFDDDTFYVFWVEDKPNEYAPVVRALSDVLAEIKIHKIKWYLAQDLKTALEYIKITNKKEPSERRGYGFDIVICDLQFKADIGDPAPSILGFEVARRIVESKWLAPVIGLTAYEEHPEVKQNKAEFLRNEFDKDGQPIFADFISKGIFAPGDILLKAKLRRHLIPLYKYVQDAQNSSIFYRPTYIFGNELLRVYKKLIEISLMPLDGPIAPSKSAWNAVPKLLLLGDQGAGKSHMAYFYNQLLVNRALGEDENFSPRRYVPINSASLTSGDQGGRISLFGARHNSRSVPGVSRGNGDITPVQGVFEQGTYYTNGNVNSGAAFADENDQINYSRGRVVFLDEFANLNLNLQVSILNAIEEGEVRRVIDNSVVRIGCHIVCATNVSPEAFLPTDESGHQDERVAEVRSDLIDRIHYVIKVPSFKNWDLRAVKWMLLDFAGKNAGDEVELTLSAEEILYAGIEYGLINSVRHLQSIANVRKGEQLITDSNFRWVLEKARILKKKKVLESIGAKSNVEEPTLSKKADVLGLSAVLKNDNLPEWTAWAINQIYDEIFNDAQTPTFSKNFFQNPDGQEKQWRYWLLATYIDPKLGGRAFRVKRINNYISKARKKFGFNDDGRSMSKDKKEEFDLSILINSERCLIGDK